MSLGACSSSALSSTSSGGPSGQGRGQTPAPAPARDRFTGSIVSGTGRYAGHHGAVKLFLYPHGSGRRRALRVLLRGRCGAGTSRCTELSGSMTGTLVRSGHQVPDVGQHYELTGTGTVTPLGQIRAAGAVEGTGFIARGREVLVLTLTGSSGSVTVQAQTAAVQGFRAP